MTGDRIIITETQDGHEVLGIPAEVREFEHLNRITRGNLEAQEQARQDAWSAREETCAKEDAAREEQFAAIKRATTHTFLWLAGCSTLIIMAHTGAIAEWVMQVGTAAWSFALGMAIGQVTK